MSSISYSGPTDATAIGSGSTPKSIPVETTNRGIWSDQRSEWLPKISITCKDKVAGEWSLICIAHNLLKLASATAE